jgi:hypothetical protein
VPIEIAELQVSTPPAPAAPPRGQLAAPDPHASLDERLRMAAVRRDRLRAD